jgi:hypothetical protein
MRLDGSRKVFSVEDDSPPLGEQKPRNLRSSVMVKYP